MQPLTDIELILSCPDLSVKCNYRACSAVLCYSGLALILFSMMINRSLGLLSAECLLMIVVPRVHVVTLWEGGREGRRTPTNLITRTLQIFRYQNSSRDYV